MTRIRIFLIILFCFWILAWVIQVRKLTSDVGEENRKGIHEATGYRHAVDLFIQHHWLQFDLEKQIIELDTNQVTDDSPMKKFCDASYLSNDLVLFNEGRRDVFRVENSQIIEVDRYLHNIRLPSFGEWNRPWTGNLTYRPSSHGHSELRGRDVMIWLDAPLKSLSGREKNIQGVIIPDSISHRLCRAQGDMVKVFGEGGMLFGKTYLIGRNIVFNMRNSEPGIKVSINGEEVGVGTRARIDPGDFIKLTWPSGRSQRNYAMLLSTASMDAPVISRFGLINGRHQRISNPPDLSYAQDIVNAIDNAFRDQDRNGDFVVSQSKNSFDLSLTLDESLQNRVQMLLSNYCRSLRGKREQPFRGAVCIMDTLTGEVLATASYPEARDLEDYHGSTSSRDRLLRNHNFARMPIGSVAKIIFAAAILQESPFLVDLSIPGYNSGKIDNILGIQITPPLMDHAVGGGTDHRIDFDEFIEHSSNKYAAILATLALGASHEGLQEAPAECSAPDKLDPDQCFYIGAHQYVRRPDLAFLDFINVKSKPIQRVIAKPAVSWDRIPYIIILNQLFDVAVLYKQLSLEINKQRQSGLEGNDLIDVRIMSPLLNFLYGPEEGIPADHPFYGVSLERENLAFNVNDNYRTQYLTMIIGGGRSSWTTIKLCEIFSWLITGQKNTASLISRIKQGATTIAPPTPELLPFNMDPAIRLRLLNAMALVTSSEGTAYLLEEDLRKLDGQLRTTNKTLGFFSKTGSPTNEVFTPTKVARAVNALIREKALSLTQEGEVAYRDLGAIHMENVEDDTVNNTLEGFKRNAADSALIKKFGVSPNSVLNACATYNDSEPDQRTQFEVIKGKLVQMIANRPMATIGGVYVFTMGIYDDKARFTQQSHAGLTQLDAIKYKPEAALTVAITIEQQGNSVKTTVPFARRLINEVLWDALQQSWKNRQREN